MYDEMLLSDLHKDAYGFRPSSAYFAAWDAMSETEKQREWDYLLEALDASNKREKAEQAEALRTWQENIRNLIALGAGNEATAIRWDMDAYDVKVQGFYDIGFYCYKTGLPYHMEAEIGEKMKAA